MTVVDWVEVPPSAVALTYEAPLTSCEGRLAWSWYLDHMTERERRDDQLRCWVRTTVVLAVVTLLGIITLLLHHGAFLVPFVPLTAYALPRLRSDELLCRERSYPATKVITPATPLVVPRGAAPGARVAYPYGRNRTT